MGLRLFEENTRCVAEAEIITAPPLPEWATQNRIVPDLDTMRVREFEGGGPTNLGQRPAGKGMLNLVFLNDGSEQGTDTGR